MRKKNKQHSSQLTSMSLRLYYHPVAQRNFYHTNSHFHQNAVCRMNISWPQMTWLCARHQDPIFEVCRHSGLVYSLYNGRVGKLCEYAYDMSIKNKSNCSTISKNVLECNTSKHTLTTQLLVLIRSHDE